MDTQKDVVQKKLELEADEKRKKVEKHLKMEADFIKRIFAKIVKENPQLTPYKRMVGLLTEIIHFRWKGKKNKIGYVQGTLNSITIGITVTKEDLDAYNLDYDSVQ